MQAARAAYFKVPQGFLEITHPGRELYADLWAAQNIDEYEFGQVVDMPSCDGLAADSEPEGEGLGSESESDGLDRA